MKVNLYLAIVWTVLYIGIVVGLIHAWRILINLRRDRRDWEFRDALKRKIRDDEMRKP